jgi:hypothetical protein
MSWVIPFEVAPGHGTWKRREQETRKWGRNSPSPKDPLGRGDGLRRAPTVGRREAPRKGRRAEAFRTPPLGGPQPPKAPIWEAAAFFSTAASAGAS